jgi:hypothetical protein
MSFPNPDGVHQGKKYFGKYKGFVRENNDPQNRGRIRCFCPQVLGDTDDTNHWTGWAEPNLPWLGGLNTLDFGSPTTLAQNQANVPPGQTPNETGVWLEFEGGDTDFPIWTGTWLPAPTAADPNAQQDLTAAGGQPGGNIIGDSSQPGLVSLNPVAPQVGTNETRLLAKEGRELTIGIVGGGSITLGAYGVTLSGVQVLANGRLLMASLADKAVG